METINILPTQRDVLIRGLVTMANVALDALTINAFSTESEYKLPILTVNGVWHGLQLGLLTYNTIRDLSIQISPENEDMLPRGWRKMLLFKDILLNGIPLVTSGIYLASNLGGNQTPSEPPVWPTPIDKA